MRSLNDESLHESSQVLRLTTFGDVALSQDCAPHVGAASQKRRLALLAVLAAAGRPMRRDQLLPLFWPGSDAERARHALRQSLHAIQRALNIADLFVGTDAIELDTRSFTSDVQDFDRAATEQAHERLIGLYRGPFLDGFFIGDAAGFERWVDAQRERRAAAYLAALESCAVRDASAGKHDASAAWWRRLLAEQPTSTRYAVGAMQALGQLGDTGGALRIAELHIESVRHELEAEPDESILALAARLRAGNGRAASSSGRRSGGISRAATARTRARDRQRAWIGNLLGTRVLLDATPAPESSSTLVLSGHDRERNVDVLVHLVDPALCAVADIDVLLTRLEAIAGLRDTRVVELLECGQADGVVYYLTERPRGESLRAVLARERQLHVDDALTIAIDIAGALEGAHAASILHEDLRPKHLFVDGRKTQVNAIGIAGALGASTSRTRTSAALRMGSPGYQSPEQLTGDSPLDARSDIYSLGCILFQMLAGDLPFASTSIARAMSAKLTTRAPSLRSLRGTVTTALDFAVSRCLERVPSDRFRSIAECRAALTACRANS